MKNFVIGLVLGAIICGAAFYFNLAGIKKTSYDQGYAVGVKEGTDNGMKEGIAKGIAQLQAEQKLEHDRMAQEQQAKEAQRKAAAARKVKKVEPVQNWHVIDGKIEDPIIN